MPIVIPVILIMLVVYVGENIIPRLSSYWLLILAGLAVSMVIMRLFLYQQLLGCFSSDNPTVAFLPTVALCAALLIYYLLQEYFFPMLSRSWPKFVTCFFLGLLVPWIIFVAK